jgi:hypothetical protein
MGRRQPGTSLNPLRFELNVTDRGISQVRSRSSTGRPQPHLGLRTRQLLGLVDRSWRANRLAARDGLDDSHRGAAMRSMRAGSASS